MKFRINKYQSRILICVVAIALVVVTFENFATQNRARILKRNRDYVLDCAVQTADRIDEIFLEGSTSIRILSDFYGRSLKSVSEIDYNFLQKEAESTLFDYIEFADKDGRNHNITGNTTDATDRDYYRRGIQGKDGFELIFNSRATHETLLMFYSPLEINGKIEGVMIGIYAAERRLKKFLNVEYFNESAETYLCDKRGRVVASNNHNTGENQSKIEYISDLAQDDSKLREEIEISLVSRSNFAFSFDNNRTSGSIVTLPESEWHLVQIFPREAGERMIENANRVGLRLELTLLIIFGFFIFYFIYSYRKDKKELLELAEDRKKAFDLIHETLHSGMWRIDFNEKGKMDSVVWSDEFRKMLGFDSEKDFPNNIHSWANRIAEEDKHLVMEEFYNTIDDYTGQKTFDVDYKITVKNGEKRWFHTAGRLSRRNQGTPETFVGVFVDITDKKMSQFKVTELEKASFHDKLTGLFNRAAYETETENLLHGANLENIAVINLDVNSLKPVNDTLGHAAGDELIKGAASCIEKAFGNYGKCFRTGGDEFVVLIENFTEDVSELVQDLKQRQESWHGNLVNKLSISVGVAESKDYPSATIAGLAKIADEKMYADKKAYYQAHDRRKSPR
ncbi:MAG: diguanylate cyclase [Treponema sp.]|nr:diguanylate cyclase [Candidatus Treponema equifaecale]